MSDPDEVRRLRERVAQLEAELAAGQHATTREPAGRRESWRTVVSAVLITLACLLAPLSATAVWASRQVSDTNRYLETVAPLAHDPAVQRTISDAVTREIFAAVDLQAITTDTLNAISQQGLPPRVTANLQALSGPLVSGIQSFVRGQVDNFVASPQFAAVWRQANQTAHASLVNLLEGRQGGALSAQNDTVTLNLAPIIALFLLALGVYVARDHRRALLLGALGLAGSMLVLGVALTLARVFYLNALPTQVISRDAGGAVFDTLVRYLRYGLRAVAVLGLIVAAAAFFTGPSVSAVRTRAGLTKGIGYLRGRTESAGLSTGRVGVWTFAHKRLLLIASVVGGALVLTFWSRPTVSVVVVTACVVLLAVALIEFIGRPPADDARPSAPA